MKKRVEEIDFLRTIACLSIVLMHSITLALATYNLEDGVMRNVLTSLQIALMSGTPIFIFISEFVVSYSYPKKLPKGFFVKRFKYILSPFIFIGIGIALIDSFLNGASIIYFVKRVVLNIFFGDFHGYFILIVFQFYFLHGVFQKYIFSRFKAKNVIGVALILNFAYLAFFNFTDANKILLNNPYTELIWSFFNKIPFLAWIAYFVIAYYCGVNYSKFLKYLKKYSNYIIGATVLTLGVLLVSYHSGFLDSVHSKRVDVILYTLSLAMFLFIIAGKLKKTPKWVKTISKYSFGIYLLHPIVNLIIRDGLQGYFDINLPILIYVFINFIVVVLISIFITYLLNKNKYGKFVVGNIGRISNKKIINNVTSEDTVR